MKDCPFVGPLSVQDSTNLCRLCVCVWGGGVRNWRAFSSVYAANNLKYINNYRTVQVATRFKTQQFYVLPTQCICVFCVDLRTNSDYFPA